MSSRSDPTSRFEHRKVCSRSLIRKGGRKFRPSAKMPHLPAVPRMDPLSSK